MSGAHRKVSRSLVNASATVSPGTGSHSQFKQSENQLKQKLDAIDTSFRLSNKRISNETRELKQILFDLQRELKVSTSVSQYVPTSIEEHREQIKRQRRITVASTTQGQLAPQVPLPQEKTSPEAGATARVNSEGARGTTTKRRRKISGVPPHDTKVLIQEDDVFGRENRSDEKVLEENDLGVETGLVMLAIEQGLLDDCVKEHKSDSPEQEGLQTNTCKQDDLEQVISDTISTQTSEQRIAEEPQNHATAFSPQFTDLYKDLRDSVDLESDCRVRPATLSHPGMFSYSSTDTQNKNTNTLKATIGPAFGYGLSYSKHFNEERKRSLSDSDANYRDSFKGRFMTQAFPERPKEHSRLQPLAPEPQKRIRRVTVSGPPPMGARRLLDIGDIPVTGPFSPGARRKTSTAGRGPTGGVLPLRRGTANNDEINKDILEGSEKESSRNNLTRPQEQRQRRSSSVRKTSSYLPPLKEETRSTTTANITNQWKNLENCRYLRKGDEELSIEDVFKKD